MWLIIPSTLKEFALNLWRKRDKRVTLPLDKNPHYLRLIRTHRQFHESRGLRWGRVVLGMILLVIIFAPIPWHVYFYAPLVIFIFGIADSLSVANLVYDDRQTPIYQLSRLTPLAPEHVIEGYSEFALQRSVLFIGFPARHYRWSVFIIMGIWLVGYLKAGLLFLSANSSSSTVLYGMVGASLAALGLSMIWNAFMFHQVFISIAVRRAIQSETNLINVLMTLVEVIFSFDYVAVVVAGVNLIPLIIVVIMTANIAIFSPTVGLLLGILCLVPIVMAMSLIMTIMGLSMQDIILKFVKEESIINLSSG